MVRRRGAPGEARRRRAVALAAAALLAVASCGGDAPPRVEGIVVEVEGDLVDVRSFVLVREDGERLTFVPRDGLRFNDGAPLSHLREHLALGDRVVVDYDERDGSLVATALRDAPG